MKQTVRNHRLQMGMLGFVDKNSMISLGPAGIMSVQDGRLQRITSFSGGSLVGSPMENWSQGFSDFDETVRRRRLASGQVGLLVANLSSWAQPEEATGHHLPVGSTPVEVRAWLGQSLVS